MLVLFNGGIVRYTSDKWHGEFPTEEPAKTPDYRTETEVVGYIPARDSQSDNYRDSK